MKVFVIKSRATDIPLAEVRTDGKNLEFVVDNTNGRLPHVMQNSFERLCDVVKNSSHLILEPYAGPTAHLLRYLMSNGDTVEITSDGKTALLNHTLLTEPQKWALFETLRTGQIKVAQSSDGALPILPERKPVERRGSRPLHQGVMEAVGKQIKQQAERRRSGSLRYDPEIEQAHFEEDELEHRTAVKNFWYWLKYGERRHS